MTSWIDLSEVLYLVTAMFAGYMGRVFQDWVKEAEEAEDNEEL